MIEKNIKSEDGTVYYWTSKCDSEVTIVFLHGLTADHHLFDKQVEHLKGKYNLIVWDCPLHGKSRPYVNFSYNNAVEILYRILESENTKKVVLVGQSAGGYIAQYFANKYPESVIGFVGIGTTPLGKVYYKKSEMFWIKNFTPIAKLYPYKYYCKVSPKSVALTKEARHSMFNSLNQLGKEGMLKATKAVYDEFLNVEEEVIFSCPVLLTFGEFDDIGYIKRYNNEWSKKIGCDLKIIEKASHNGNYDNFIVFNNILIEFVELKVKKHINELQQVY